MSYTRGVNNNVHTKSEYQVRAHMPIYQRPLSPYRRVPGVPGIPCVASAHGPAGPCLPQAAPGTYGAPCTAAHPATPRRPRERCEGDDSMAALCRAGGGRRFPRTSPELPEAPAPPAVAGTREQRPASTTTALPAATAAAVAALGGGLPADFRRPRRLRSTGSKAVRVSGGQAARLVQCAAGHAHDSKS